MQILVGCDPETFVQDRTSGAFVSGHGMLPGTKLVPHKVRNGMVQIDGTALEFGIDPAKTCEEFINNIADVMAQMQEIAGADKNIVAKPVAEYDPEYFKTIPPEALELGCNPDFNSWTMDINQPPDAENTFRTGSGHVHIGWGEGFDVGSEDHFLACCQLGRQMDYYLGLATLEWDPDSRRRQMYGKAGAMRPKPYGFEYRVPSNHWLNTKAMQTFVYEASVKAVTDLIAGDDKAAQFGEKARELIDNNVTDWRKHYDFGTGLDYDRWAA